jgi:agmatine deiminase
MTVTLAMPPEWAPHERCVVAWPCRADMWGGQQDAAKAAHAAVVNAIVAFEPVLLVANPGAGVEAAAACPDAEVVEWPLDDSWARDIGAIVLTGDGRRAGLTPVFNGWGEKFHPYDEDARFAVRMCEHLGLDRVDAFPFVLEGGAITVDGAGAVITTEQCLLNPNRNPSLDRAGIEAELRKWLGVDRVVWLPYGLIDDDDTDGHVDNVALCVRPGVVLAQTTTDPTHADHDRLRANVDVLVEAGYEVVEIDVLPEVVIDGRRAVVPPLNLYLANGAAIVPVVDGPEGDAALAAVRAALPEREVVGVPGDVLAFGGGGIHCITQQVPR